MWISRSISRFSSLLCILSIPPRTWTWSPLVTVTQRHELSPRPLCSVSNASPQHLCSVALLAESWLFLCRSIHPHGPVIANINTHTATVVPLASLNWHTLRRHNLLFSFLSPAILFSLFKWCKYVVLSSLTEVHPLLRKSLANESFDGSRQGTGCWTLSTGFYGAAGRVRLESTSELLKGQKLDSGSEIVLKVFPHRCLVYLHHRHKK